MQKESAWVWGGFGTPATGIFAKESQSQFIFLPYNLHILLFFFKPFCRRIKFSTMYGQTGLSNVSVNSHCDFKIEWCDSWNLLIITESHQKQVTPKAGHCLQLLKSTLELFRHVVNTDSRIWWAGIASECRMTTVRLRTVTVITVKKKLKRSSRSSVCSNLTLAGSSADVGNETSSARVWLGRALLTGVAPCSANGSTAEGFGADDSTELALTHLIVHLCETWPSPVICGEREARIL